jgi:hypothetical protein
VPQTDALRLGRELWKRIIAITGDERAAKNMMRVIMKEGKPGPRSTDQKDVLKVFIYACLRRFGPQQSDEQIAAYILTSGAYYLQYQSGAFGIASNDLPEATFADDTIVERITIDKSPTALKKQVERVRKWTIRELLLSEEYSPRCYSRG